MRHSCIGGQHWVHETPQLIPTLQYPGHALVRLPWVPLWRRCGGGGGNGDGGGGGKRMREV